jgi:hypothetical protein
LKLLLVLLSLLLVFKVNLEPGLGLLSTLSIDQVFSHWAFIFDGNCSVSLKGDTTLSQDSFIIELIVILIGLVLRLIHHLFTDAGEVKVVLNIELGDVECIFTDLIVRSEISRWLLSLPIFVQI